jgi:hypothetical protein
MFDFAAFLKSLRATARTSSADIRDALNRIDLSALAEAMGQASEERKRLLIEGTDQEVAAAERKVAAAQLALDRATAIKTELAKRLAATEAQEAKDVLTAERGALEKESATLAADLRTHWPRAQSELVSLLTRLNATAAAVESLNQKLGEAGRGDERIESPEWRVRPRPEYGYVGVYTLTAQVILPVIEEWRTPGYHWRSGAMGAFTGPARNPVSTENWPKPVVLPPTSLTIFSP